MGELSLERPKGDRSPGTPRVAAQWRFNSSLFRTPYFLCASGPPPPSPPFGQAIVRNIVPSNNFAQPSTSCLFLSISLINFSQYLADVEEHLGETISVIQPNMKVSVNQFDGKVQYGEKRRRVGKDWVFRPQLCFSIVFFRAAFHFSIFNGRKIGYWFFVCRFVCFYFHHHVSLV